MDLLGKIRIGRARQRTRQKLEIQAYDTVSCIVKTYGLGKDFLKRLDRMKDQPAPKAEKLFEVQVKASLDLPPYSLVSQEEYELVATLLSRLSNPYLLFARRPEELLLSLQLYELNPLIQSHELLRHDFETLLLRESVRKELADLERRTREADPTERAEHGCDGGRREGGRPAPFVRERINQLQTFMAEVEHMERKTE